MQFYSHGKFRIWNEGHTVFAELTGSWNEEAAIQFETEFKRIAAAMPDRWAHLVYLNDWQLCVPAMAVIIQRLVAWCIDNGLVRAANVYRPSAMKSTILNKMIVQQQGKFTRAVFDNDVDGAAWLTQEGFPTTVPLARAATKQ